VVLPNTEKDDGWVHLAVSARITGRSATVALLTVAPGGTWATIDTVTVREGRIGRHIRGADLSSVPKNEDHGPSTTTPAAGGEHRNGSWPPPVRTSAG